RRTNPTLTSQVGLSGPTVGLEIPTYAPCLQALLSRFDRRVLQLAIRYSQHKETDCSTSFVSQDSNASDSQTRFCLQPRSWPAGAAADTHVSAELPFLRRHLSVQSHLPPLLRADRVARSPRRRCGDPLPGRRAPLRDRAARFHRRRAVSL